MKKGTKVFWGVTLVSLAVVLIMNQLGLIHPEDHITARDAILGLVCFACFASSLFSKSITGFFFSCGLTWVCFGEKVGLPPVSIGMALFIVILMTAGVHFIVSGFRKPKVHKITHSDWDAHVHDEDHNVAGHSSFSATEDNGYFVCKNSFGETAKYLNSNDLKGATLENSFGALKVYFDNSTIIHDPIEINVENSFGEMQIFVPKTWGVKVDIKVFAGEAKESYRDVISESPVVYIRGKSSFGELQINYV